MKSSNTSTALRCLERRGFTRSEEDPDDGRAAHLFATQAATDNLVRVRAEWAAALQQHIAGAPDVGSALAVLKHLDQSLNQAG